MVFTQWLIVKLPLDPSPRWSAPPSPQHLFYFDINKVKSAGWHHELQAAKRGQRRERGPNNEIFTHCFGSRSLCLPGWADWGGDINCLSVCNFLKGLLVSCPLKHSLRLCLSVSKLHLKIKTYFPHLHFPCTACGRILCLQQLEKGSLQAEFLQYKMVFPLLQTKSPPSTFWWRWWWWRWWWWWWWQRRR